MSADTPTRDIGPARIAREAVEAERRAAVDFIWREAARLAGMARDAEADGRTEVAYNYRTRCTAREMIARQLARGAHLEAGK